MVSEFVQSVMMEPRVAHAPKRVWRDWALLGVLTPAAMYEVLFRGDLSSRPAAFALGVLPLVTLLWRRTHPLAMVAIGFTTHAAAHLVTDLSGHQSAMLVASAYLLLLPYALFRWGSGREAATGLAIIVIGHIPMITTVGDIAGIVIFLLFPAALGAAVRYRTSSKVRELDQVRMREREQLARELHDTVAHHVSAIIIQAQAGRTVAATDPESAVSALEVIEAEASRTLAEMRTMVGALRNSDDPDLSPQRGVADIERLASEHVDRDRDGPTVDVELVGQLDDLRPSLQAALYRLAQESITNAVRHSRHATRIAVSVAGDPESVRLTVRDDGLKAPTAGVGSRGSGGSNGPTGSTGYGLVGMAERAKLLGGTLECGPDPESGWTVTAVLPRDGVPA